MSTVEQPKLATIEFSTFSKLENLDGKGGAIFLENSLAIISHCSICNCAAKYGGGIYATNSEISVSFSIFDSDISKFFDDNLGSNAVCVDSGNNCNFNNIIFDKCAPQNSDFGESVIVSQTKQFEASFLNISSSFGFSGGFLTIFENERGSQISYINIGDSNDYSLVEHANELGHILHSNFVNNTIHGFFMCHNILCEECVFIRNSEIDKYDNVVFENCIGKFPGNPSGDENAPTLKFPIYRFRASKKYRLRLKCCMVGVIPIGFERD